MREFWIKGVDCPDMKQPPLRELSDFITPNRNVFWLRHMSMPVIDRKAWRLKIGGFVEHELEFSIAELKALRQTEVCAFHECAGNPFNPTVPVRRVANVRWGGIRLKDIIGQAGVKEGANFVWSYGADSGNYDGIAIPAYIKDLPIAEIDRDEVLLALQMNGEDLSDEHGGPLRLVVPGYYATNSTKWLRRLELQQSRSPGFFTTVQYNDTVVMNGKKIQVPVWRVGPHSVIVSPCEAQALQLNRCVTISGWAWGADPIVEVEVSTDGGEDWRHARVDAREGHSWQRFEIDWTPLQTGDQRLLCRCVDSAGVRQPTDGARNSVFFCDVTVG
jgi:DMSO/TMAO reductase YedYZ molybdopterin-dependent catalytic subunit